MGTPCVPLTERQELIAELEGLGYDTMTANALWRENLADQELKETIVALMPPMGDGTDNEPHYPDILEMVDALRKAAAALTAMDEVSRAETIPDLDDAMRARDQALAPALAACRDILNRIELASEPCRGNDKQQEHIQ